LSGTYSQFDGRAGGTQSVAAPSGAPKGAGFGRDAPPGATADNKGSVGPTYQAQGRPANLSLFAPERGALADAADYLPNPVHDLPPEARAAMNRGYVYSSAFVLGGGAVGRLAGWALARLGWGAAKFDWSRAAHIFREAEGHVNPASAGSQARFAQLFENVASNPANLRPDAVQAGIITRDAANAGVRAFTQLAKSGEQIWVTVRNGLIQNAGVNPVGAVR